MPDIQCIIIEDEPLAVKILTDYIAQVPFLKLQGSFKDAILGADYLRHHNVHLIFLDIHLPKLKGMAFLKTLTHPPAVIITTAYHQYAVEGFNLNVTDYLLKPFDFERFLVAVTRVKTADSNPPPPVVPLQSSIDTPEAKAYIFVTVQKKKVKILFADIVYIESQREYIKIVTTKMEFLSKLSTHEMEALLPAHLFRRIHRSFIVAISKIDSYTADTMEVNGVPLPIGRGYRDSLENL
jgi:two-component system, LytTR family, response regulator